MSEADKRNMLGNLKKFNRAEHRVYDTKGKDAALKVIDSQWAKRNNDNWRTIENPNQYGIDLLTLNEKEEVVACWEVEVRHGNWRGDVPFPFREINCIERKDHQWRKDKSFLEKIPFKMAEDYRVFYMQLNKECNRAVVIKSDTILKYPLKPWRNRKAEGEYVRQVPITETVEIRF